LDTPVLQQKFQRLCRSKRALAIPVTFLILFVSMLGVISVTYYFAIEKMNASSQYLKVSMAKQNMESFDDALLSVIWQSGSSRTLQFDDCGGTLRVQPSINQLVINITDGFNITGTVFNATVGRIIYELPYSESPETGLFLKGDSRVIVDQSSSTTTQLSIENGPEHPEILLCYRPVTSSTAYQDEDNTTVNEIRLYLVNLNSSQDIELMGSVPLEISCTAVQETLANYTVSYEPSSLTITASMDGTNGEVTVPILPISSTVNGATIDVELIVCNVAIERWVM
jgi:hypothetical protein